MIAPNGLQHTTRAEYVEFHRQWFASNDNGRFDPEIVHIVESPRLGHALINFATARRLRRAPCRTP